MDGVRGPVGPSGGRSTRRQLVGGGLALGMAVLAGCGGDDPAGSDPPSGEAGFPARVRHLWGTTTVPRRPTRIVSLGVTDADVAIALGTPPVANTGYPFFPGTGLGPWAERVIGDRRPQKLESDSEVDIEQVATLRPDLILAVSAGFDKNTYDKLSRLAPVIARPPGVDAYTASRTAATRSIARAMGRVREGERLIAAADGAFARAVREHPQFAGKVGTVVLPFDGRYGAFLDGDLRGQVLDELGFDLPGSITAAGKDSDSFFVDLSRERLDAVDGDVLIVLTDEEARRSVRDDRILASLDVTRRGALLVPDTNLRGAMTYNTVLSADYLLQRLVPQLVDALNRTT